MWKRTSSRVASTARDRANRTRASTAKVKSPDRPDNPVRLANNRRGMLILAGRILLRTMSRNSRIVSGVPPRHLREGGKVKEPWSTDRGSFTCF
jgi:hypothetical protein